MEKLLKCFVILAVLLGSSYAADIYWTNNGSDQVWTNTANWNGQILPGVEDVARLNKEFDIRPFFSDGMNETVKAVIIGMSDGNSAGFEMTGGTLTLTGAFSVNDPNTANHRARFDMSGGTLSLTDNNNFRVGWNDNDAWFNMTGGLVTAGYGNVGEKASIVLQGGTVDIRWNWTMDGGSVMDIREGTLIVRNADAREEQIQGYIDAGNIIAYGGAGKVSMTRNGSVLTVTATGKTIRLILLKSSGF
ncbi:MAG: hypothetical protein AB7E95_14160 [Kiritimatiellales bacterium]